MKRPALLIAALLLSSPAIAQDKGSFSVHQRLTRDSVLFFYPGGMFFGGSNQGMANHHRQRERSVPGGRQVLPTSASST